jgi:phenylpropionate dioxygenase-like ring-hydroxylating dioxygenase large terminal subunit
VIAWHPVGPLNEIPIEQLIAKIVSDIPVVIVRTATTVTALRDRCAHRFAPLSLGKVVNGTVQCPYHGLRFGLHGGCVFNPHGDGAIPSQAKVTAYPVEQRDGEVFIGIEQDGGAA